MGPAAVEERARGQRVIYLLLTMCCLNRLPKKTEEEATLCQAGGGGGCGAGGDGPKWIKNLPCNCGALIDTGGGGER